VALRANRKVITAKGPLPAVTRPAAKTRRPQRDESWACEVWEKALNRSSWQSLRADVIHGAVCCWFGLAVLTADFRFWEELLSASHRIAAASAPQTSRGLMILFALNPRPLLYAIEDQPI